MSRQEMGAECTWAICQAVRDERDIKSAPAQLRRTRICLGARSRHPMLLLLFENAATLKTRR
uniref:Transcriptional regulator n=1 Tax=Macrostomum lignano TaxID=282301 RepID=A0A1I8F3W6_9PLAT